MIVQRVKEETWTLYKKRILSLKIESILLRNVSSYLALDMAP